MVRILTIQDFEAYSKLRSLGLQTDPTSFWASEEEERPVRKDRFEGIHWNSNNFIIGYFLEDQLVSIAGFTREDKAKLDHKGFIWGVYTHPDHRGKGFGKDLVMALTDKAFQIPGLTQINLSTGALNSKAISLYEKLGFEIYGKEINSSKVDGQFYDEVYMTKFKG